MNMDIIKMTINAAPSMKIPEMRQIPIINSTHGKIIASVIAAGFQGAVIGYVPEQGHGCDIACGIDESSERDHCHCRPERRGAGLE